MQVLLHLTVMVTGALVILLFVAVIWVVPAFFATIAAVFVLGIAVTVATSVLDEAQVVSPLASLTVAVATALPPTVSVVPPDVTATLTAVAAIAAGIMAQTIARTRAAASSLLNVFFIVMYLSFIGTYEIRDSFAYTLVYHKSKKNQPFSEFFKNFDFFAALPVVP